MFECLVIRESMGTASVDLSNLYLIIPRISVFGERRFAERY